MSAAQEIPMRMSANELSDNIANGCGWNSVMTRLCPELEPTINKNNTHVDCKIHGGESDLRALPDFDRRGKLICTCQPKGMGPFNYLMLAGHARDFNHAYELIADAAGYGTGVVSKPLVSATPKQTSTHDEHEAKQIRKRLIDMGRESFNMASPESNLIRKYYEKRGMPVAMSPALRVHNCLRTRTSEGFKTSSGILALVTGPDGKPLTFHRTFVTPEGEKAFGKESKRIFPVADQKGLKGAAIRFYETGGDVLDITEGVVTANAVHHIDFGSVWSTISTSGMEGLQVPDRYSKVRIWLDRDPRHANRKVKVKPENAESLNAKIEAGEKVGMVDLGMIEGVAEQPLGNGLSSALKLAFRLIAAGKTVELLMPAGSPEDKLDWEDVFLKHDLLKVSASQRFAKAKSLACRQVLSLTEF